MPAAHASDSERFEQMQHSLKGHFESIAALTAVSQPAMFAILFGVDMCFRFLKLGSRIRQLCAEQGKEYREKVSMQGFLLPPAYIRPTAALVESYFLNLPTTSEVYQEMEDQIEIYKTGDFRERRKAAKKLKVAYWLLTDGRNWQENPALLELVNAEIRSDEEPSLRQLVDAVEPLYGKDSIGIDDFDQLLEHYALQDMMALQINTDKITAEYRNKLCSAVRDMYWETLVGQDENLLSRSLHFLILKKLEAKKKQLEDLQMGVMRMSTAENADEEREKLELEIERLEKFATPLN